MAGVALNIILRRVASKGKNDISDDIFFSQLRQIQPRNQFASRRRGENHMEWRHEGRINVILVNDDLGF